MEDKQNEHEPFNNKANHHQMGSFGKASISSAFSIKSNSSVERDSQLDTLLKTIAKDPAKSYHGHDSLNDANYKVTINKTSELETNTDTLKKLSAVPSEKPNNQMKITNAPSPLPPGQIKCNILKG